MQLVYEFFSPKMGPIVNAIRSVFGTISYTVNCRPTKSKPVDSTEDSLETLATKLESGDIPDFSLHPRESMIRYALVLPPSFEAEPRSLYMGTIEYTGENYKPIWELLLGTPALTLVCLGYDEGVELRDDQLTVETFPWNEWPLVVGALRTQPDSGAWTIREGPEMHWFTARGSDIVHPGDASS